MAVIEKAQVLSFGIPTMLDSPYQILFARMSPPSREPNAIIDVEDRLRSDQTQWSLIRDASGLVVYKGKERNRNFQIDGTYVRALQPATKDHGEIPGLFRYMSSGNCEVQLQHSLEITDAKLSSRGSLGARSANSTRFEITCEFMKPPLKNNEFAITAGHIGGREFMLSFYLYHEIDPKVSAATPQINANLPSRYRLVGNIEDPSGSIQLKYDARVSQWNKETGLPHQIKIQKYFNGVLIEDLGLTKRENAQLLQDTGEMKRLETPPPPTRQA